MLREALELQILEQDPERAAGVIGQGVTDHGPSAVAQVLLEATAFAFRRMVSITDEVIDLAELLTQPFIKDSAKTVADLVSLATQKFGERIEVASLSVVSVK